MTSSSLPDVPAHSYERRLHEQRIHYPKKGELWVLAVNNTIFSKFVLWIDETKILRFDEGFTNADVTTVSDIGYLSWARIHKNYIVISSVF